MFLLTVILAALAYSFGGYFMKLSNGFSHLGSTVMVFVLFVTGAALQIWAMRNEQMTVTYIVVLGLEAIVAFGLGVFLLGESSSLAKIGGTSLVLAGILLLRFA